MPRIDLIQLRRGTASEWTTANPTLEDGEIGFETDTRQFKVGNGSDNWSTLQYTAGGSGSWDGNATGLIIRSLTSLFFDIDNNGDSTNASLRVTKDGLATELFRIDEDGKVTFAGTQPGAFTGSLDLTSPAGAFYDEYNLGTSGQITFSIASSNIGGTAYIVVNSDGTTEFATKANLDSIFDEQYNIPSDRILDSGLHRLYILKTPSGASLSIPSNQYNPDTTAPTVTSATVENADPDALVVVFSESVNVTDTTGLTLTGDMSAITIDSITSGNGTNTVTFALSTDVSSGNVGTFAYSGSNTITDVGGGNDLAAGSTSVTNNVSSGLVFTLDSALTETSPNFYEKTGGTNSFGDGFAVSTTQIPAGPFNYRVEFANANEQRTMIGISTDGTNRAYNTSPAWNFAAYGSSATQIRDFQSGLLQGTYTPPVAPAAGQYLEIRRDGSDNVQMFYDGVQYGTTLVLSGAVYLHFMTNLIGYEINNPETY